ncbi:sugar ABC transporter substrate-binding protein, partial [Klebsiella pneumoniae]|nr:sugar ABC transporter substrate-binding protein [Klebsiella pneumoniae]
MKKIALSLMTLGLLQSTAALQEGKKLGFKISTFLSNGDDAKFQDFVNQAI